MSTKVDIDDHPLLKRITIADRVDDWADWINWMTNHYGCTQADIARRCDVSGSHISQIKNGKEPSEEMKLCLASYAINNGPRPPAFKISRRLNNLLRIYVEESEDE